MFATYRCSPPSHGSLSCPRFFITLALLASLKTKLLPEPKRDEARARTSLDIETQALLNLLADWIATAKVLLLVNYRPEYPTSS